MVHKASRILKFTNYEKERMLSMNINKYNANNNNHNGKEARGTEKYIGHNQHRYAAIAAAFAIIVG